MDSERYTDLEKAIFRDNEGAYMGKETSKKVCLVVNRIVEDAEENMNNILSYIYKASKLQCDLIVFSESAITGYAMKDVPEEDIKLGIEIDDCNMNRIKESAKKNSINIAMGFFEKEGYNLYDSAVFINRYGESQLKYRRISTGWRLKEMNDSIYREGKKLVFAETEFGKTTFLICGDLFEDRLVSQLKNKQFDFLIFPYARSFYENKDIAKQWEKEKYEYIERIKRIGKKAVMVNYIDNDFFGGAMIIDHMGKVVADKEVLEEGILIYDMDI